jgi:hypothetical protein
MSEELDGATPESTEEVTPTETPVEPTKDAVETETTPVEDDFSNWTVEDAVARLKETRAEAARYRSERNTYKDAFEGFEPEDVELYLGAVKNIRENPTEAHAQFSGLVEALAAAQGITTAEAQEIVYDQIGDDAEDDSDELVTKSELVKFLAQKEMDKQAEAETNAQAEATEVARKEIDDTIEELGYKPDTTDYNNLLYFATKETEGSTTDKLKAADTRVQAEKQAVIDNFLAAQAAQEDLTPPQSDGAAPTPAGPETAKSINAGAKNARAALDAMFSGNAE